MFQTAFVGDVILTTPTIQVLHKHFNEILIDVVAIPSASSVLENHPSINSVIKYDKRVTDRGFSGAYTLIRALRRIRYDAAIIPHRSLRSLLICFLAGIPRRIGFSTSAARFLLTDVVKYRKDQHEIFRNLSLLEPLSISLPERELPNLYPSATDVERVRDFLKVLSLSDQDNMIAIAPGSVWATKRWLPDRFAELAKHLIDEEYTVVLVGGNDDLDLGRQIEKSVSSEKLVNAVGEFSLLQSAELLRRCKVLVSNDSAPMHLAVAVRTPVVAIFGATVPEFGFAPLGDQDIVVQTMGLDCRPCSIHGGESCPIKTFVCMKNIPVAEIVEKVHAIRPKLNLAVHPKLNLESIE